ncbi:MAG TPA: outer membrane protein assembly factor BamD [Roseiarcus sp.]|nr:outer membrane protein assembly factor BamD [Roseiarcus sp.]
MHFSAFLASRSDRWGRSAAVFRRLAAVVAVAAPLAACGSFDIDDYNPFAASKYKMKIEPDVPASQAYDQGLARLAKGDGSGAAKKFTDLSKDYPYSDWSKKALLMTAYSQFEAGEYDNCEQSAERYAKLYPDSPDAAYAVYLAASSYYSQIPDISRDQERAEKALAKFTEVVEKYPNSEYVNDSKFKIQVTRDQLAGKEMSIGRFYLNRRNYLAAINRFRIVLANYQTTRHSEEALYRLTEAYLGLGVTSEAQTAAAVLGHNYPDSQWYKDAYALLKGGGLEPSENPGSWISQLYRKVVPG